MVGPSRGDWRVWLRAAWTGVQAVVIGVAVTFLFRVVASPLPRAIRTMASAWVGRWVGGVVVPVLLPVLGALLAGYVVVRLHQGERRLALRSYVGFVLLLGLPRAASLVTDALDDTRYLAGLGGHLLNLGLVVGAIALGGWLGGGAVGTPASLRPRDADTGPHPG